MLRLAISAALSTAALTLTLAACGSSDADDVRSTYNRFHSALASEYPTKACELMTKAGSERFARASNAASCEQAAQSLQLSMSLSDEGDAARTGLRNFRARAIIFADEHRRAIIQPDQLVIPEPWHLKDGVRPIVLVERSGKWLIEDLGS